MSSAAACGHGLRVHASPNKGGSPEGCLGECICIPRAVFIGSRRNVGLTSSCLRNELSCSFKVQNDARLRSRECMQIARSGGWHVRSSVHQKRLRVHAFSGDGEVQKSSGGEKDVAPGTNDGGVNEEEHAEEKAASDTQGNHLRATAKRIAYQAKLLKYNGWIHDPAEAHAHDNWVPIRRDKEQGLPLIAVIGLTAGSVVLAIILALQGWNRVRHRVPELSRLPFVSKWHPVAEPKVDKPKENEPKDTAAELQGTPKSATPPSKEDQEKEHISSSKGDNSKDVGRTASPPSLGQLKEDVSPADEKKNADLKVADVKGNSEHKQSEKSAGMKGDHKKRGGGNLLTALFGGHGKGENKKGESPEESLEPGAVDKSNKHDVSEESKSESKQGPVEVGEKIVAKAGAVVEGIKEKVVVDEKENGPSDKEKHGQQEGHASDKQLHSLQTEHASNKEVYGQQVEPESNNVSHSQQKNDAADKQPHRQQEKLALGGPSDSTPKAEKQFDKSQHKEGVLDQGPKESGTPLGAIEKTQEQQGEAGQLKSKVGKESGDEAAPVVLQPAVNVLSLTGGDAPKAPPSSPKLEGGSGTPVTLQEEKGGVPERILKVAADMLSGTEPAKLGSGEKSFLAEERLEQPGSEEKEEERKQVKNRVSKEETASREDDDQADDEGLSNPLKGIWPAVEFFEEGGEMEFGEGGVAKALGFPPLPVVPLQSASPVKAHATPSKVAEATPTRHDKRRPSLAGGEHAPVEDPPARSGPDAGAPSGGESFQDWYAKQWNGKGSAEGGSGGTEKRPPPALGELKPSAYVDTAQLQTLQALQKLNVVDENVEPTSVCSRRDFARWLLSGSRVLTGSPGVFPVPSEGVTETAFDDVTPEDKDFGAIQGLAEAGILPSRLTLSSTGNFQPDEPVTRQDLVRWKLALDRRRFPTETDAGKAVFDAWGFTDVDLIDADALPALVADFEAGDQSVVARAFGYTLRFQPQKQVSIAQAAAALAAGSAADTVAERVSEMEAYRAADEVFREEVREQREIIEAVSARGEEIVKNLEEDKETLAETRAAVEEAIKELDAHRDAIRRESEQLAQSVDSARSIIEELTSVHSVSEAERNTLQAELQRLEDERAAVERVTSDAEAQIDAGVRRARAAVEGLEEVRETLKAEAEGRHLNNRKGGSYDKPLVELFDDGMEAAGDRPRNILKRAMRAAETHLEAAKGHLSRLHESTGGHVSQLRESTSGHVANLQSSSADVMATLKEKTGHVAEAGTEIVRDIPDKARKAAHRTIPQNVRDRVQRTSSVIWTRVREALVLAWEALVRVWRYIKAFLEVVVDRVKGGLQRVQGRNHPSAA